MRAKATTLLVFVFLFSPTLVAAADEALPKPGDPSYISTLDFLRRNYNQTREASQSCLRRYLSGRATPTSEIGKLGAEACDACKRAMSAESKATYEFDRLLLQDANRTYDSKLSCNMAQVYASEAIEVKKREADQALQPAREAKFREKAIVASECQKKHVLIFALSTSESPENISTAAFNKCAGLYQDAAEALFSPSFIFGEGRLKELCAERVEELRKATVEKDIAIVVEARARQRIEAPKPPVDGSAAQPATGSGI